MASSIVGSAASHVSQEVSRSKQAMDIRVHELTDREVQLLTGILSRRPSFGIGRPSKRWLEHQARLVASLPAEIKRPGNFLKRFVVKYGDSIDRSIFEYPPAVLCPTHYELHPRLMRRLFVMVLDEVTRHADRLRRSAGSGVGSGSVDPHLAALVDRVDGLGALWMEPELYLETFHAPPSDRRMVKVESFCEACTLAVLGANARTLADLRALILDRAERLSERRERRRHRDEAERARRHEERKKRHEERKERRKAEWEEEERLLEEAKNDPEREQWLRTGRAKDADRERHDIMLDELEAKHRRHREKESRHHPRHEDSSRHSSRRGSRHHNQHHRERKEGHGHDETQSTSGQDRRPRLLRVAEVWIDHLGEERAAVARAISDETLDMLRQCRGQIDRAARQSRAVRPGNYASQHHHRSRQSLPVVDAAAAPEGVAELRRAAGDFYRNSAAACSVYRPDSLAGGMSHVGVGDKNNMPPPPMCGQEPELAQGLDMNGEGASGMDPYDCDEDEDEEEYDGYDEYGDEDPLVGYPEDERDYAREERSREKVAAWAVNAWAQSHRDLPRAELERGARSVIEGMHPAFRPAENAQQGSSSRSNNNGGRSRSGSYSNKSAVPQPLAFGGKDKEKEKRKGSGVGSAIGSALGLGKKRDDKSAGVSAKSSFNESAVWTDVSVHTDWRDRSRPHLSEDNVPPVPSVPSQYTTGGDAPLPPPVPSLMAGIDPNQSTEAFPEYADQLADDEPADNHNQAAAMGQKPAPWTPHKPSRKYCYVDSDVGTEVAREHRRADREYLKKNTGFLREPVNPADNPFVSDPARSASVKRRSAAAAASHSRTGTPVQQKGEDREADDPWAKYERASSGGSRSGAVSRAASRSTAPTSVVPGGPADPRALTPKVASTEEEREWRRNLTGLAEEDDDDLIRPDDSASNINWKRAAARDDVTELGDFMRRAC